MKYSNNSKSIFKHQRLRPHSCAHSLQYFSLGHCIAGLDTIVRRLFGVSLEVVPMERSENWDPSVRCLTSTTSPLRSNAESEIQKQRARLICFFFKKNLPGRSVSPMDLFSRPSKFVHAANFAIQFSHPHASPAAFPGSSSLRPVELSPDGYILPRVALVCSFPSPSERQPPLLSHADVETLFHEFGHSLAALFSRTGQCSFPSSNAG